MACRDWRDGYGYLDGEPGYDSTFSDEEEAEGSEEDASSWETVSEADEGAGERSCAAGHPAVCVSASCLLLSQRVYTHRSPLPGVWRDVLQPCPGPSRCLAHGLGAYCPLQALEQPRFRCRVAAGSTTPVVFAGVQPAAGQVVAARPRSQPARVLQRRRAQAPGAGACSTRQ